MPYSCSKGSTLGKFLTISDFSDKQIQLVPYLYRKKSYGIERDLHERPSLPARYNELPERRHRDALPKPGGLLKPKEIEADMNMASLPAAAAESNDYEALDAVMAVSNINAQEDIDDKRSLDGEDNAKVDLTTL